jgi:hypothetical protein
MSSVRILEPLEQTPKQSGFRIYIFNNGPKPFNFGPENITIKMPDGTAVAMLTYQDLIKAQKRKEMWEAVAVGLTAAANGYAAGQAGYNSGTASYSGNTFGRLGSDNFSSRSSGTATFSSYNAGAAYAAQADASERTRRDVAELQMNQAAKREDLAQVMKMTTVDPGQPFGGIVQYNMPALVNSSKTPVPVTIEVQTGDEVHTFQATLAKYKR